MSFLDDHHSLKLNLMSFHADWCGTCQTMSPILDRLKEKLGGKAQILNIDTDKNPQIAIAFQVRSLPTLILFKNGEIIWRHTGLIRTEEILEIIEKTD